MSKALRLFVKILWLIDDLKTRRFHADEILTAELPVMPDLPDFEPPFPHIHEPVDHVRMVNGWAVAHREPAVVLPTKKRDVVLLRLDMRGDNRKNACVITISTSL